MAANLPLHGGTGPDGRPAASIRECVMTEKQDPKVPAARDPFTSLRSEVDRLFDEFTGSSFMRGIPTMFTGGAGELRPQTDIKESDSEIVVTAELPGVKEKDISLTLQDKVLTIKGEKKSETKKDEDNYHMVERSYGSFQRSFRLPDSVDEDACTADFSDGVLKVTVNKRKDAQKSARRIEIGKT